jgi:ABC-2 type transport system permease protein
MRAVVQFADAWFATARKDMVIYLRQWKTIVTSLVMPGTYILVALLGSIAVGRNPVALVVQDQGTIADQVAQAIVASDVFRVSVVSQDTAQALYDQLAVGAIVTIPPGFSLAVQRHLDAPILVVANNLNLDFMNDIRRSVPDAITVYYGELPDSPLNISVDQRNLRPRDVDLFQYEVVPLVTLLVTVCGLIASSSGAAREFESLSIKEIMLAPTRRAAVVLGKVTASWTATCCMGLLMLGAGYALGWTRPEGPFLLTTLLAVALVALLASAAGIALGCVLRRVQSVSVLSTTGSVWLFFLSGGLGIIQFEPVLLRQVASFDPLTYGTHMLQMAIFYNSFDRLPQDVLVLAGASAALFFVSLAAMRPGLGVGRRARVRGRRVGPFALKGTQQ